MWLEPNQLGHASVRQAGLGDTVGRACSNVVPAISIGELDVRLKQPRLHEFGTRTQMLEVRDEDIDDLSTLVTTEHQARLLLQPVDIEPRQRRVGLLAATGAAPLDWTTATDPFEQLGTPFAIDPAPAHDRDQCATPARVCDGFGPAQVIEGIHEFSTISPAD